ncbi:hypothetical protein J28TS4_52820 [Paenibacillus lautus]|nr:hypothetical protein J28TS4_52820 [Paenibacillus lautus]
MEEDRANLFLDIPYFPTNYAIMSIDYYICQETLCNGFKHFNRELQYLSADGGLFAIRVCIGDGIYIRSDSDR